MMKEKKVKTLKIRLDEFDWCMLENLSNKLEINKSKLIRFLIEKEYIEQNEKENW